MNNLVIVESPAKAKTINKYLGSDYKVLASFGHIRDLPSKDGSVDPHNDFKMIWETTPGSEKHIKEIVSALKDANTIILASDPDREGEAIAWHIIEELNKRGKLIGKTIKRVTFNEITKNAVLNAIANPREIDLELVNAYLARRALDYLVGFELSPILWRKLPGSRSAGRVQSVALRLICERENDIESFKADEYWTIKGIFRSSKQDIFPAILSTFGGKRLEKLEISNETQAQKIKNEIARHNYNITEIDRKTVARNPAPSFTTSTLQQEASRKLGFSAKKTMQIAQGLYEGIDIAGDSIGLITYMRTDGVAMASEAIASVREQIAKDYGKEYLPDTPRFYKNNVKNAQEAHEAIRPTNMTRTPESVAKYLNKDQLKLYSIIYKRSIASQMQSAKFDKVSVTISSENKQITFKTSGMTTLFDGFLKVYFEDFDDRKDDDDEDENRKLPPLSVNEQSALQNILPEQHFTQAPPRYSEASIVKKLEELGIGRPSTYASIISVLQDRNYVKLIDKRFIPENRGRLVTTFLENFFSPYVQYDFTADMENDLDKISEGKAIWKQVISNFWNRFSKDVKEAANLTGTEVIDKLGKALSASIFPTPESKKCPACSTGTLNLKLGKYGAFIGCSNYPECKYIRQLTESEQEKPNNTDIELGQNPTTKEDVTLKKGPYGYYIQQGIVSETKTKTKGKSKDKDTGNTGKRVALPKNISPDNITLDIALGLLNLPRNLGNDPATGTSVMANIGRFGPYVQMGKTFKSLGKDDNVLTISLDRAVFLLSNTLQKTAIEIGQDPTTGKTITMGSGRFGPYVKMDKIYASIPKSIEGTPTLEQAIALITAKIAKISSEAGTTAKRTSKTKTKAKVAKK